LYFRTPLYTTAFDGRNVNYIKNFVGQSEWNRLSKAGNGPFLGLISLTTLLFLKLV